MVSGNSSTSRLACSMRSGVAARCAASTSASCSGSTTGGGRIDDEIEVLYGEIGRLARRGGQSRDQRKREQGAAQHQASYR